jgi:hypothetical protein
MPAPRRDGPAGLQAALNKINHQLWERFGDSEPHHREEA